MNRTDSKIIEEWEEEDKTITTESLIFDESSEIQLKDDTEDQFQRELN